MEVFYDTTNVFSGTTFSTANLFLPEVWKVKEVLRVHLASEDEYMRKMAYVKSEKFDKYWGDCNIIMSVATILDPRCKFMLKKFCFPNIYPANEFDKYITEVQDKLFQICEMYIREKASITSISSCGSSHSGITSVSSREPLGRRQKTRGRVEFDIFIRNNDTMQLSKSELEIYLRRGCYI